MKSDKPICLNSKVNGKQPSIEYRIYDIGGVSTAITTCFQTLIAEPIEKYESKQAEYFGIRKLTPRECFRLMDVEDEDIDKLMTTDENGKRILSNSSLYKLAGNSIVVSCLSELYKSIWQAEDTPHYRAGDQLSLF